MKMRVDKKILITAGVIILGCICLSFFLHAAANYGRVKCADFANAELAQKAYNNGAKYLDANRDGVACNKLK